MDERSIELWPAVSQRLGEMLQDKDVVVNVLNKLRWILRENAAGYRANRDEEEPDFLFNVPMRILLHGRWRVLRISVNDTISPDHFIVEAVSISDWLTASPESNS